MPTYRNPCANNPLLRKGGTHIRSKTGQRSRDHYDLLDEAAECFAEYRRHKKSEIDYEPVKGDDSETDDLLMEVKGEHDAPLSFIYYPTFIYYSTLVHHSGWCCNNGIHPA